MPDIWYATHRLRTTALGGWVLSERNKALGCLHPWHHPAAFCFLAAFSWVELQAFTLAFYFTKALKQQSRRTRDQKEHFSPLNWLSQIFWCGILTCWYHLLSRCSPSACSMTDGSKGTQQWVRWNLQWIHCLDRLYIEKRKWEGRGAFYGIKKSGKGK